MADEKKGNRKDWIKDAVKQPGALRKSMGKKEGEKITSKELSKVAGDLKAKAKGDKTLSPAQRKLLRRATLAQTLGKMKKE